MFNYNLPDVPETYVHRIGRTGRAGRGGAAVSFCDVNEKEELKAIEKLLGRPVPVVDDHPWPMEVLEPAPRDKKGRVVNPEDAEARAAAKERRRQRGRGQQGRQPGEKCQSGPEGPGAPTARAPGGGARPQKAAGPGQAQQRHPGGGPHRRGAQKAGAGPAGVRRLPEARPPGQRRDHGRHRPAALLPPPPPRPGGAAPEPAPKAPGEAGTAAGQARAEARPPRPRPTPGGAAGTGGRSHRPMEPDLRKHGQKDSTEQPSLMKPYYLSDD